MKAALPKKVLIANRGEIALRVIRACHELGISVVAVYSTADESALFVKMADEAVCIGPPPARQSYLHIPRILAAAEITRADAVHPGYGFLSENYEFARACREAGLIFIGPSPENIRAMGEKTQARRIAREAGVALLPGTTSDVPSIDAAVQEAELIGYPVILKAAGGGGGRGIHIIQTQAQLRSVFDKARAEALAAFGNAALYLEKYCQSPRHVEIQVVCDRHGQRRALGERDCTIQRRHQKVVEEAPSPIVDEKLRAEMNAAALALCNHVDYENVGTVEFLVDNADHRFYFMEMNTRIQVEHPVTEMVTGVDLIQTQIRVAAGFDLDCPEINVRSHAIECRINAEDSVKFMPSPGLITSLHVPGGPGVRVDSFIYAGYHVVPHYDSMLGKLIVHAPTRAQAIVKMGEALREFAIDGIQTNLAFQRRILASPRFASGLYDTKFLENFSA